MDTLINLAGRLFCYSLAVFVTSTLVVLGMRLDNFEAEYPIQYTGDVLLILPMVYALNEDDTYLTTSRLGAPEKQELYDFPLADALHFLMLRGLLWSGYTPIEAFNWYYLLTYPLATFTAMIALRAWGRSFPLAIMAAVLYAFLPYHQIRSVAHYFLSAYWVVPLSLMLVMGVALNRTPRTWSRWLGWLFIAVLTASGGGYYAYFSCALLLFAGLHGSYQRWTWRPLGIGIGLIGIIFAVGLLIHLPTILHQTNYGRNTLPTERTSDQAEKYGLKIAQFYWPITNHRVRQLADVRRTYDVSWRVAQTDNETSTLGIWGCIGLTAGILSLVRRRVHPGLHAVGWLLLFSVSLATIGGLGSIFNHVVSPQVRAYNRISIFVAFLAFFVFIWLIDRLTRRRRWLRWSRWLIAPPLLVVGLLDMTDSRWGTWDFIVEREVVTKTFKMDGRFFREMENQFPEAMVFQIPVVPYPEVPDVGQLGAYDHVRGFLHTKKLKWSFGSMKGRETDQWQREVSKAEVPEMLRRITLRGFDALYIDKRGMKAEEHDQLLEEIKTELQVQNPALIHTDGMITVWDLRPYRIRLLEMLGESAPGMLQSEKEKVRMIWLRGFESFEPIGQENRHIWCKERGESWFVNPGSVSRRMTVTAVCRTECEDGAKLQVLGLNGTEEVWINKTSGTHTFTWEVPPGHHRLIWNCSKPKDWRPKDPRRHLFFVAQIQITQDR
ncbi:MAG: hypothetical protein ACRC8S_00660 [Fimbriiglobus sp.]